MRFYEFKMIKPIKPLTPQQARIASLKKQKENVSKELKVERNKEKIVKAQQAISQTNH
jgi:hypothetical protein